MKLIRLKIKEAFRSLHAGFEIQFQDPHAVLREDDLNQFHPYCFAGLNGSGKSNVLEALANLFYHLECCALKYKPDGFNKSFKAELCSPNAFELEYYIGKDASTYAVEQLYKVSIVKEVGKIPKMSVQKDTDEWQPVLRTSFKTYLPDLVVAYSSGENEILSLPFLKMRLIQYDEYLQTLEKNELYEEPESSLLYMDAAMSQGVLLANLLFQEENVLKPLKVTLGIAKIESFRLNIQLHRIEKSILLIDSLNDKIDKLKNCATCWYANEQYIVIDFYVESVTKQAVRANYQDAFAFFRDIQILYLLNYQSISPAIKETIYQSKGYYAAEKLPTPAQHEQTFYFSDYYLEIQSRENDIPKSLLMKQLSDGEHQFLHTMGICLLLENRRTLLLLDEPETHFNPDWRSKFIKILKNSVDAGGGNNLLKEIILTTHSPFIISDCLPNKVIVFEKDVKTQRVSATSAQSFDPPFNTYGTSIDVIVECIFKNSNTIGAYSKSDLQSIDFQSIHSKQDVEKAKMKIIHLGDSLEKDLILLKLNKLKFHA